MKFLENMNISIHLNKKTLKNSLIPISKSYNKMHEYLQVTYKFSKSMMWNTRDFRT